MDSGTRLRPDAGDTAMDLVLYPDPILRKRAASLQRIDAAVRANVRGMFEVMYREHGIGLAAPQVSWSARLFVLNLTGDPEQGEERVYVNPCIVRHQGEVVEEEGCLSIPDVRAKVARHQRVVVQAQDLEGALFEEEIEDLHARAVQHEIDHLDGILFIQRLSATERMLIKPMLKKLEDEHEERWRSQQ
jgi:peptide deformylase